MKTEYTENIVKVSIFRIIKVLFAILAILLIAGGVFFFGYRTGVQGREVIIQGVVNQETGKPDEVDFSIFWDVWKLARQNYFKADSIDNRTLVNGAISGMIQALGDPHSAFLPPEETKRFEEDIAGEFGGVGMEIGMKDKMITVIAPLKDTPAERAGIHAGDTILKIDETFTADMPIDKAVKLIRGPKGTKVTMLIMRDGWDSPRDFTLVRDTITVQPVKYTLLDGRIAHIELYNFNENVSAAFYRMAIQLIQDHPRGIILDLRNNPGGYLEVSVNIAGWFLNRGELVTRERFKSGDETEYRATGNTALRSYPLVVLADEGSASAAEILAGALRDNRGIKLIGTKTFGKGSVQEVRSLRDNSSLKISIAQWLTPKGTFIDGVGLMPDVAIESASSSSEAQNGETPRDVQLEKAREVLEAIIGK